MKIYPKIIMLLLITIFVGYFFVGKYNYKAEGATTGNIPQIQGDYVISNRAVVNGKAVDLGSQSVLSFNEIDNLMREKVQRLVSEFSREWTVDSSLTNLNPDEKPEGQVWTYSGNLNISGEINGKGTIVVTNGDLNIQNDLIYTNATDSIGFIVLDGEINISQAVENIVGAYFSSNKISFNQ